MFFVRFLFRGSIAEQIRLYTLSKTCACYRLIKQLDKSSETFCREFCDTDLTLMLELSDQQSFSCATEIDILMLKSLFQSSLPSVDKNITSIVKFSDRRLLSTVDNINLEFLSRANSIITDNRIISISSL